jgi:hypothetical protein
MAHTVTVTKLMDGERNAAFHVFIKSDGASADLTDYVIIDPAISFNPALNQNPVMTVNEIYYDLAGFDAFIEFDYLLSDTPLWVMSGGQYAEAEFDCVGGLKDRSNELDGTGKLQITTSGLTAGKFGSIIIKVRKD